MEEEWCPIEGFPGYAISNLGRVRGKRVTLLRPGAVEGYPVVCLYDPHGRRQVSKLVHSLVCAAFHGPRPDGYEVAHLDGDRANPRADNLAWVTRSENQSHRHLHGTHSAGERNPRRKLTAAAVAEIRAAYAAAPRDRAGRVPMNFLRDLATRFGVGSQTIQRAANGTNWRTS